MIPRRRRVVIIERLTSLTGYNKMSKNHHHHHYQTSLLLLKCPLRLDDRDIAEPRDSQLSHLDGQLEQVIQTLAHGFRLVDVLAPHIDAMPPHQHGKGIRELLHGLLHELGQILLVRRVLDDGDAQRIMVAQVPLLAEAAAEALDLLDVVDLKDAARRGAGCSLKEERDEDGPLRMSVNAAAGVAAGESSEEERGAL